VETGCRGDKGSPRAVAQSGRKLFSFDFYLGMCVLFLKTLSILKYPLNNYSLKDITMLNCYCQYYFYNNNNIIINNSVIYLFIYVLPQHPRGQL
jgi:hypothetical protein